MVSPTFIRALVLAAVSFYAVNAHADNARLREVGTNLQGISDYGGDWPFLNRMKSAREWITYDATGKDTRWDTGVNIPSDANGYPLEVPFDPDGAGGLPPQSVRTILISENEHYPAGTYTLLFEGKGKIHVRVDAQCPHLKDGQCVYEKPDFAHRFEVKKPTTAGLRLEILASDPSDRIRNIRILPPGVAKSDADGFHPVFLEILRGFKILRFMDWESINHSGVVRWSERVPPGHYSYACKGKGVPYEVIVDLSNRAAADPWIVVPTLADDDYVRNLAQLIGSQLDKSRSVYLEYSNEVWNTIFPQSKYATQMGEKLAGQLGVSLKKNEANALYYAKRSAEVFEIFEKELAGRHKVVKILSGQGMNPAVLRDRIRWLQDRRVNPKGVKADALSIALYFGASTVDNLLTMDGQLDKKAVGPDDVRRLTVDVLLDNAGKDLRESRLPRLIEHRELANQHGMKLLAYEGGQSLKIGPGFSEAVVQAATDKVIQANRTEKMGNLYREMFDTWFRNGGDAFVNFSLIYRPNRWGAWGILEYQSQSLGQSSKYQSVATQLQHNK